MSEPREDLMTTYDSHSNSDDGDGDGDHDDDDDDDDDVCLQPEGDRAGGEQDVRAERGPGDHQGSTEPRPAGQGGAGGTED